MGRDRPKLVLLDIRNLQLIIFVRGRFAECGAADPENLAKMFKVSSSVKSRQQNYKFGGNQLKTFVMCVN